MLSLTPPSGQAVSQGISQSSKPETEEIDKETVMTQKIHSSEPPYYAQGRSQRPPT